MHNQNTAKHIFCCWELGGELGHLVRLANITRVLEQRSYRVSIAVKDVSQAIRVLGDTQATLLQAPVWLPTITLNRPIACMADTLMLKGYLEPDGLQGLYRAWYNLTSWAQPDLILYDYSPTALLANHQRGIPAIGVGTGFIDPVPGHPIADWRQGTANDDLIARQEARVLSTINEVCTRERRPPISRLSDIYATSRYVITTYPALDIYQATRSQALYRPFNNNSAQRVPVRFPEGTGPKIIAYLKPKFPHLDVLLKALSKTRARVFIACPGGQAAQFQPYASDHLTFSTEMVELEHGIAAADLFMGHGNMSSVTQSLQAGTPTAIIPIQMEQLLTGQQVQKAGAGILINNIKSVEHLTDILNEAARSQSLKEAAQQFQRDNLTLLQQDLAETVADLCDELLGTHS